MNFKWALATGAILVALLLLTACAGPQGVQGPVGPAGPAGPEGPQGPAGPAGPAGQASTPVDASSGGGAGAPAYIGDNACAGCHQDIYDTYSKSGHPWILNKIEGGSAPDYPYTRVNQLPEGYTWNDILYVIGGYNWKALFVNTSGAIITGAPGATGDSAYQNQYNVGNAAARLDPAWASYHAGEGDLSYDCGGCHTTGYNRGGNQNDLPGMTGTWAQDGVRCEACHGPGSLHMGNPSSNLMRIERDSSACTACHVRDDLATPSVQDGFISFQDHYNELPQGKHALLRCVECHDPHQGVKQAKQANEPATKTKCQNCHWQQAAVQNNPAHTLMNLACVECHMPRIIQVGGSDAANFTGDLRTHRMAINPSQISQVSEDGTRAYTEIGLDFACRHCHGAGLGAPKTDEELINVATGYHDRAKP